MKATALRASAVVSLFPGAVALACAPHRDTPGSRLVTDSAGVEVVSIWPPADTVSIQWTVESIPALDLGVADGAEVFELSGVAGAVTLSDGRIVVGESGVPDLRFYGSAGEFLFSTGADGEGPGEFRSIDYLGSLRGDTIVVHDGRLQRVSLFSGDGVFLTSRRLAGTDDILEPRLAGIVDTTTLVSWDWDVIGFDDNQIGVYAAPMRFGVTDLWSGGFREAGTVLSTEEANVRSRGRVTRAFRPFGRKGDVAARGDHFFVLASSDDRSILVYASDGALRRILRVEMPLEPVDASAVETWAESWIRAYSGGSAQLETEWRRGIQATPPPDNMPVFRSLEVDVQGNVCAERYPRAEDAARRYWCLSPEGHLVRIVSLPEGFRRRGHPHFEPQLELGADYVLGVWQDALDVEHVRMYRLKPPGSVRRESR